MDLMKKAITQCRVSREGGGLGGVGREVNEIKNIIPNCQRANKYILCYLKGCC